MNKYIINPPKNKKTATLFSLLPLFIIYLSHIREYKKTATLGFVAVSELTN